MERIPEQPSEEIRIIDGKKYRKVPSGYTVRQYYSHETLEKGPGPGWDIFSAAKEDIAKRYGFEFTQPGDSFNFSPQDLPDEPLYLWEEVEE